MPDSSKAAVEKWHDICRFLELKSLVKKYRINGNLKSSMLTGPYLMCNNELRGGRRIDRLIASVV